MNLLDFQVKWVCRRCRVERKQLVFQITRSKKCQIKCSICGRYNRKSFTKEFLEDYKIQQNNAELKSDTEKIKENAILRKKYDFHFNEKLYLLQNGIWEYTLKKLPIFFKLDKEGRIYQSEHYPKLLDLVGYLTLGFPKEEALKKSNLHAPQVKKAFNKESINLLLGDNVIDREKDLWISYHDRIMLMNVFRINENIYLF